MCLVIEKDKDRQIATKDITCYKLMLRDLCNKWKTPYREFTVCDEVINGEEDMVAKGGESFGTYYNGSPTVHGGFIHTFFQKSDAISYMKFYATILDDAYVFECIIPKGTEFYIGTDTSFCKSYASKLIRFSGQISSYSRLQDD